MPRRLAPIAAVTCSLAVAACGGGDDPPARAPAAPASGGSADRSVVSRWADTLRRSDVEGAARFFAVPVLVEQGGVTRRLRSREEVRAFNDALPCGARLTRATSHGGYLIGTFRLGERPGASCDAPGGSATVAVKVAGGRIREWRQIPELGAPEAPPADAESA